MTLDALRGDKLHAVRNNAPLMPHLTALAKQGVEFTNTTTAVTWTRPSIVSFLTSLYMDTHQVFYGESSLSPGIENAAAFFRKAGYSTCAIVTAPLLDTTSGLAPGFDVYDYAPGRNEATTTRALARLDVLQQPFFFFIHFIDPHPPSTPPAPYFDMMGYPPAGLSDAEKAIVEDFIPYQNDLVAYRLGLLKERKYAPISQTAQESVRMRYDAEVRYADDQLERILSVIESRFPNTLIIVSSDHGEQYWEHDWLAHAMTLYNVLTHIPLVIKGPGISPAVVDAPAESIDVLPTMAAYAGLPARPSWQGVNLLGTLDPERPVFSRTVGTGGDYVVDLDMVKKGAMNLILDRKTGQSELYDLAADPGENANLATKSPEQVDKLTALLETRRQQNIRARGSIQPKSVPVVDQSTRDQLEALGYLQSAPK